MLLTLLATHSKPCTGHHRSHFAAVLSWDCLTQLKVEKALSFSSLSSLTQVVPHCSLRSSNLCTPVLPLSHSTQHSDTHGGMTHSPGRDDGGTGPAKPLAAPPHRQRDQVVVPAELPVRRGRRQGISPGSEPGTVAVADVGRALACRRSGSVGQALEHQGLFRIVCLLLFPTFPQSPPPQLPPTRNPEWKYGDIGENGC